MSDPGRSPLPPVATGIALGIWFTVMVILAMVIVPTIFAMCSQP